MQRKRSYIFLESDALNNIGRDIYLWFDLHSLQIS